MDTKSHTRRIGGRKAQGGYTLLEYIIVVALIGIALGALAWGINKGFGANDIKDETSNITKVMSALPDLRSTGGYGTTGANLVPQLIAQNEIPSTWSIVAGVPQNAWGGTIAVVSKVTYVDITGTNYSQEACNKLAVKLSRGASFKTTKINAATAHTGEVTSSMATTDCTASANTIIWSTPS